MRVKDKFVALEMNSDNTCKRVLICKNITDGEYKKLINEQNKAKQKELDHDHDICFEIAKAKSDIVGYEIFIAKSVYDNFVDRGLIDDDDDFQKAWFDFIFEKKKISAFPKEFEIILERVRGK